tara:strand:- start:1168 stop:1377 length:210 start_codon:yes stop_codon:yes gene_type:complete
MSNPNDNMNAYKQALQINRDLKKEMDAVWDVIDEFENYLLNYNVTSSADDREIGRLQDMIDKVRSRDEN